MKEATGELNMTVITVVAIAAIAAFFYAFVWPSIKNNITGSVKCSSAVGCTCSGETCTCKGYYGEDGKLVKADLSCPNTSGSTPAGGGAGTPK